MSDKKPKIGVVGAGHLGKHHIKHLSNHSGVELVGVFDINTESLKNILLNGLDGIHFLNQISH